MCFRKRFGNTNSGIEGIPDCHTLRMSVRASIDGDTLRVRLSNPYGNRPLFGHCGRENGLGSRNKHSDRRGVSHVQPLAPRGRHCSHL